eukprot:jgi/Mesvir1/5242/Mv15363-RA.1
MSLLKKLSSALLPLHEWAAARYRAVLAVELKKYGLRVDDLFDADYNNDVHAALNRLPPEVISERNQRLKRAMDLSMKHTYLPKEMQEKQTPFEYYLQEPLKQVLAEKKERLELGVSPPYNRQIP